MEVPFEGEATAGVLILDAEDRVTSASHSLLAHLGRSVEDVVGAFVTTLWTPDERHQELLTTIAAVRRGVRDDAFFRVRFTRSDAPPRATAVIVSRRPSRGDVALWLASLDDGPLPAQTHPAVAEIASLIAHEVKNPLAGVVGAIRIIADRLPTGGQEQDILHKARLRLLELNSTLDEILLLSRPVDLRRAQVMLTAVLGEVVRNATQAVVSLNADVGPIAPSVNGDHALLVRLFSALVNCASRAEPGASIKIRLCRSPKGVRIEVGPWRGDVDAVRLQSQLSGADPRLLAACRFGLLAAQRIAEAHGASIEAVAGEGGAFAVVELPPSSA